MVYKDIIKGTFIERPNRFIGKVWIDGRIETVHVKNTGRCRELLNNGASVILEKSNNPNRKTNFSLISVYKNEKLINIDSQAPNFVVYEALKNNLIDGFICDDIKREVTYKKSRFDLFFQNDIPTFMEVKGVTLFEDSTALFPDAITQRGTKHLNELVEAKKEGYGAYVFFLIQASGINLFTPNIERDPIFAEALKNAHKNRVGIFAYTSLVTENSITIGNKISISL